MAPIASRKLLVLCDVVGQEGGTESLLSRVLPVLQGSGVSVTVRGRQVREANAFGVPAQQISWGADDGTSSAAAAAAVEATIAELQPDAVFMSSVFDPAVIRAARTAKRAIAHLHDHRAFCPQGDRVYPQFRALCERPMGVACIVNSVLHGCADGPRPGTLRRLREREVLREALRALDAINVGSRFMARLCAKNGIERGRINAIAPAVDPAALESPPAPMPRERRVLFAARLVRDKGFDSLVRAVARIAVFQRPALDVCGAPTPESEATLALARRLGVVVNLHGRQSRAALMQLMDAAAVVAVPSLWPEPFGMMGIEAYARGRPVVAYAVGGIPEWVESGGVAVPPGDEAEFARALVRVLDPGRWEQFATEARRLAQRYTPEVYVGRLLPVLFPSTSS